MVPEWLNCYKLFFSAFLCRCCFMLFAMMLGGHCCLLKIRIVAGKPEIIWKKGNADSIDLYVDRNDGKSFVYLANDANPNYTDNTQLSDGSNMSEWKYKGIYRIKDEQVGDFSDVISIVVKKEVA